MGAQFKNRSVENPIAMDGTGIPYKILDFWNLEGNDVEMAKYTTQKISSKLRVC